MRLPALVSIQSGPLLTLARTRMQKLQKTYIPANTDIMYVKIQICRVLHQPFSTLTFIKLNNIKIRQYLSVELES